MLSVGWEFWSGCATGYFKVCGLVYFSDWQINCRDVQVPWASAQGSHTFLTCCCGCCMTGSKIGMWPMFRFVSSVLRPYAQLHSSASDTAHRCWAKCKLTSADWLLPYRAVGHPQDMLWQILTFPAEVISCCTWVCIALCYWFQVFLQVIDLVFVFPHSEKADYEPFPSIWSILWGQNWFSSQVRWVFFI